MKMKIFIFYTFTHIRKTIAMEEKLSITNFSSNFLCIFVFVFYATDSQADRQAKLVSCH